MIIEFARYDYLWRTSSQKLDSLAQIAILLMNDPSNDPFSPIERRFSGLDRRLAALKISWQSNSDDTRQRPLKFAGEIFMESFLIGQILRRYLAIYVICSEQVFDVTRKVTYKNLQRWYEELRRQRPSIPCICVANKIDGKLV